MQIYKRKILPKILKLINREAVLILQGARRVGKTALMQMLQDILIRQGKRTVYYDLTLVSQLDLKADLTAKGLAGTEVFVFLDNWRPEFQLEKISEAHLLAAVAWKNKLVSGIKTVELFALSFDEFLEFKGGQTDRWQELYREFIQFGGYPEVVLEPIVERKKQLLWQVVDIYLRKDLTEQTKINNIAKFIDLIGLLAGLSGKILDLMAVCRESNLSFPTLQKYLAVLDKAMLVERISPYSRHPATEISQSQKLFFLDSGLQSLLWLKQFQSTVMESVFKTSIFSELVKKLGRGTVGYWRTKAGAEIDFIVRKKEDKVLAIDASVNFQRLNPKYMTVFKRKYNVGLWRVIGLEGEKLLRNGFYPWEM